MNRILALLAVLVAALIVGCGGNVAINRAHVRYVDLVPDGPQLDFYQDGTRVIHGLDFLNATGYNLVDSGSRTFTITQLSHTDVKATATTTVQDATPYTVIATGRANPTGAEPGYQLYVIQDPTVKPAAATAGIRVFHAAPSTPALDWYFTNSSVDFNSLTPDYSAIDFGTSSYTGIHSVGSWRVRATLTGTKTVVLDTNIVVSGRNNYTVFARDALNGGTPIQASLILDGN